MTRQFLFILAITFFFGQTIFAQADAADFDNDGISNNIDLDDDNDGISDEQEKTAPRADMDFDGHANHQDLDSDNDGIADAAEAGFADVNGDGIVDGFVDANQDGVSDEIVLKFIFADLDADGLNNWVDTDSDNNGITDTAEAGALDINNDGRLDSFRDNDLDGFHDKADGDVGNMLAPGDNTMTATSGFALSAKKYQPAIRLVRPCADSDVDGLCNDYDGDLGNQIKPGYDFVIE